MSTERKYTITGPAYTKGPANITVFDPVVFQQILDTRLIFEPISKYSSKINGETGKKDVQLFELKCVDRTHVPKEGEKPVYLSLRFQVPEFFSSSVIGETITGNNPETGEPVEVTTAKIDYTNDAVREFCLDIDNLASRWYEGMADKREDKKIACQWKPSDAGSYLKLKIINTKKMTAAQYFERFNVQRNIHVLELAIGWCNGSSAGATLRLSSFVGFTDEGRKINSLVRASGKKTNYVKVDDDGKVIQVTKRKREEETEVDDDGNASPVSTPTKVEEVS